MMSQQGFEVGPSTGTNVLVISVIHRVRTNPEVKMVMPKGGFLDPGGRADPISPNVLASFTARRLLHNLGIYLFFDKGYKNKVIPDRTIKVC